jgi:hypothetical protein
MNLDATKTAYRLRPTGRLFRTELDRLLAQLCRSLRVPSIRNIKEHFIHFDFEQVTFIHLDATVWLVILIAELRERGNDVLLTLPDTQNVSESEMWSFLIRWRFFKAVADNVDLLENILEHSQLGHVFEKPKYAQGIGFDDRGRETPLFSTRLFPIAELSVSKTNIDVDDEIDEFLRVYRDLLLMKALCTACGVLHDNAEQFLSYILAEGVINSCDHSRGDRSLVAMQVIDARLSRVAGVDPCLVIVVADNGIGIPEVLRSAKREGKITLQDLPQDDANLIESFTQLTVLKDSLLVEASTSPGMRSDRTRGGMGLYYARYYAEELGAVMRVRSGSAEVIFSPDGETTSTDYSHTSPGTVVKFEVPLKLLPLRPS